MKCLELSASMPNGLQTALQPRKMYLTVSHTEDGGMNFSYHYQTAHLEEHDMELLYYYMMRILFKGIAEPDMSIGEIMEQV